MCKVLSVYKMPYAIHVNQYQSIKLQGFMRDMSQSNVNQIFDTLKSDNSFYVATRYFLCSLCCSENNNNIHHEQIEIKAKTITFFLFL